MKTFWKDVFTLNDVRQAFGGKIELWWIVRDVLLGAVIWYFWGLWAFLFSFVVAIVNYCMVQHEIQKLIDHYENLATERQEEEELKIENANGRLELFLHALTWRAEEEEHRIPEWTNKTWHRTNVEARLKEFLEEWKELTLTH